jgi:methylmalonyl-CoA/ethylmalonyl-CoA epimerase
MEITHIEHIGIAVKSIEEQLPYYEGVLGLKCYNIETVEDQKVKTAFFKIGQTKIELLEPTAFCAAFDISFDDFIISECFIYTLP